MYAGIPFSMRLKEEASSSCVNGTYEPMMKR